MPSPASAAAIPPLYSRRQLLAAAAGSLTLLAIPIPLPAAPEHVPPASDRHAAELLVEASCARLAGDGSQRFALLFAARQRSEVVRRHAVRRQRDAGLGVLHRH